MSLDSEKIVKRLMVAEGARYLAMASAYSTRSKTFIDPTDFKGQSDNAPPSLVDVIYLKDISKNSIESPEKHFDFLVIIGICYKLSLFLKLSDKLLEINNSFKQCIHDYVMEEVKLRILTGGLEDWLNNLESRGIIEGYRHD